MKTINTIINELLKNKKFEGFKNETIEEGLNKLKNNIKKYDIMNNFIFAINTFENKYKFAFTTIFADDEKIEDKIEDIVKKINFNYKIKKQFKIKLDGKNIFIILI